MPYKNKADRKKQKNPPVGSAAHKARMERQRARRAMDKKGKALSKGGSNADGVRIESKSTNRSRNYKRKN